MEKLDYLIRYLLDENKNIKLDSYPVDYESKKKLYRALCNIREAKPIDEKYIQIENEYLQEELKRRKITKINEIKNILEILPDSNIKHKEKICLWQGDITSLKIDAIVNAGNSQGVGCFIMLHKCLDNQVHSRAGVSLRIACDEIMKKKNYNLKTGEAIYTKGFNLPAKYVIQTVGPIIYEEVSKKDIQELANCYINSLKLAMEIGIRNIAFPCISTGEFRFPKTLASQIAIESIDRFLNENREYFDKVVFNVYGEEDYKIYERNIKKYYKFNR